MFHIPSLPSTDSYVAPPPEPMLFIRSWMSCMGTGTEHALDNKWTPSETNTFIPSDYLTREEQEAIKAQEEQGITEVKSKSKKSKKNKKQAKLNLNTSTKSSNSYGEIDSGEPKLKIDSRPSYYTKQRTITKADIEAERLKKLAINNDDDFEAMMASVVHDQSRSEQDKRSDKERRQDSIRDDFKEIGNRSRQ